MLTCKCLVVRMWPRMNNSETQNDAALIADLQNLIVEALELEDITPGDIAPDAPLFSDEGLGLDSIDAMELGVALKRRYKVTLNQETKDVDKHFATIASLAQFITENTQA